MSEVTTLSIRDYYRSKCVFVTGASGFAGKSLVQRLLETVQIERVYILLRGKKGLTFEERFKKYLSDECFSYFAEDRRDELLAKIRPVEGDISVAKLGLSDDDYNQLVKDVHVVFHAAASVRFAEQYKTALNLHIFGTQQVLQLCRDMAKFEVLVHLSSISCWFVRDKLGEKVYMTGLDPLKLWKDVETMTMEEADIEGQDYIGEYPKYPNSYIFTKTMTEVLMYQHAKDLKVVIARLPFIGSAYKSPTPGWFDTIQTINAMCICVATGTIRTIAFEPETKPEFLPVDLCSNALIATGADMAMRSSSDCHMKVINVTPKPSEIPNIYDAHLFAYRLGKECPSIRQLLPPVKPMKRKATPFEYWFTVYQTLALGCLVDLAILMAGHKMFFVKLLKKINYEAGLISITLHKSRIYPVVKNFPLLYNSLSKDEQELFYCDPKKINWSQVLNIMYMRFRRKFMKEPDTNISQAVERMKRIERYLTMGRYVIVMGLLILIVNFAF